MYQKLTKYEVADRLRADEYANWSYEGALRLAEELEDLEADLGQEFELDVVAIRCDWGEFDSLEELITEYPEYTLEDLENETYLFQLDNGHYIIKAF